jgi:hypothetical protein
MRLEDLQQDLSIVGLEPSEIVSIIAVVPISDAQSESFIKIPQDHSKTDFSPVLMNPTLELHSRPPLSFDGDGDAFKLAVEAKRIDLAFLFDPMMAVHASNVEPLPHQITAVYESMLPRQPLRYVLADDPGAGKTIMAGLYIRELLLRADARREYSLLPLAA